jgi:23S rRNA (cytidine1920-2'-O)/16S rRNA (cytidine1409-2'-O)-methyltransferase
MAKRAKKRPLLDVLAGRYPDDERESLMARVSCGEVFVEGERVRDPKREVALDADIALSSPRYVSRGGEKLEAALGAWKLAVAGKVFLDAGASTGGFTDCLLAHGARLVHAVDVGYNQLAYRLRRDSRVQVHERTNIREIESLDPSPDAAVCDLSFRSLRGIAGRLLELSCEGWAVALVKPQFELRDAAGGSEQRFDGVLREEAEAVQVLDTVLAALEQEGAFATRVMSSPLRGRRGNREFLCLLERERSATRKEVLADAGLTAR